MKKRWIFLLLSAFLLCGVSLRYFTQDNVQKIYTAETVAEETAEQEVTAEEPGQEAGVEPVSEEEPGPSDLEQGEHYAYSCLAEEDKLVYLEILKILQNFQENITVSLTEPERIGYIFQCVLNDHPEIFYVQGYTYTRYTVGDKVVRLTLSGTYTMNREEAAARQEQIEEYADECLSALSMAATDYEKVRYIYEYIIYHTEYNQKAPDNQNICSVFLRGESVCQGYAKAVQYLLNRAGVFCTLVIGSVSGGEGHAWNLVRMNGSYYYVDATWGDASYQSLEGETDAWSRGFPSINYDYLGVTTEQLLRTHTIQNVVPMPRCVSMDCNYYVMENAYIAEYSEEALEELFEQKQLGDSGYITLKCASDEIYDAVKEQLLGEQKIFEYIHQADGVIAYSDNEAQMSLSFWRTE